MFARSLAFFLLLVVGNGKVLGEDYVMMWLEENTSTPQILYHNPVGTLTNSNTFNSTYCIWSKNGNKFTNQERYLRNYQGNNFEASTSSDGWSSLEINSSNELSRGYYSGKVERFLRYNNGWTTTISSASTGIRVVYQCTKTDESISSPGISGGVTEASSLGNQTPFSVSSNYTSTYYTLSGGRGYTVYTRDGEGTKQNTNDYSSTSGITYTWSLSDSKYGDYVSVSDGVVNYKKSFAEDTNVKIKVVGSKGGASAFAEKEITFRAIKYYAKVSASDVANGSITVDGSSSSTKSSLSPSGSLSFSVTATPNSNYKFTGWSSTGGGSFASTSLTSTTFTANASGTANGTAEYTISATFALKTVPLSAPAIVIVPVEAGVSAGNLKNQAPTATATIYGTAGSGTLYYRKGTSGAWAATTSGSSFTINKGEIIQAYTKSTDTGTYTDSKVASGGYVVLQDLEDHNWTYYKGVDVSVGGTAYKTKYASDNVKARIYSPNPRNVEIIYDGCGYLDNDNSHTYNSGDTRGHGVQVSIDNECENTFIYYETLDRNSDGTYTYPVIPNPFSVRPSTGQGSSKQYYGCRKWIVTTLEGGSIKSANGSQTYSVGSLIDGDTDVKFVPSGTYTTNCISMKVVLSAFWERAVVAVLNNQDASSTGYTNAKTTADGGHRELQFIVLNKTEGSTLGAENKPVTFTMVMPDGSADYRNNGYENNRINYCYQQPEPHKVEFCRMAPPTNGFDANHFSNTFDLHLGRGLFNYNGSEDTYNFMRMMENEKTIEDKKYKLRVESGTFRYVSLTAGFYAVLSDENGIWQNYGYGCNATISNALNVNTIWGCDYDRAKGDNSKLRVKYSFTLAVSLNLISSHANENYVNILFKSGRFYDELPSPIYDNVTGATSNIGRGHWSVYLADAATQTNWNGFRYIEVQGGSFLNFAGGWSSTPAGSPAISYRIKGGTWGGCIYGSGSESPTDGDNYFIFTGGTVKSWIAGGCNGVSSGENYGTTNGTAYMYIGGNTKVTGEAADINGAQGGNIFPAGNGLTSQAAVGKMSNGTNVVIADNAQIANGVYGGGHSGYTLTTANVIMAGGSVGDGLYGGSKKNQTAGENANVILLGGTVSGGVYGGCNESGTLSGDVSVSVTGGTVGSSSSAKRVCGGGLGSATRVSGNVSLSIGGSAQIYGDAYGGSALGYVNGESVSDKKTTVTMSGGTLTGSLYGGGLGDRTTTPMTAALVNGPVTVSVTGGQIGGNVFGCNNAYGSPSSTVTVTINKTSGGALNSVYGGGNQAAYTNTTANNPSVTLISGTVTNLFGGGLGATAVLTGNPKLVMKGGTATNLFGGGDAAKVVGNTTVSIQNGTIGNYVFGGGNNAEVDGSTSVTITGPTVVNGNVYGGGNAGVVTGTTNVVIGE